MTTAQDASGTRRLAAQCALTAAGGLAVGLLVLDGDPFAQLQWVALAVVAIIAAESLVPRLATNVRVAASEGLLLAPVALLDPRSAIVIATLGVLGQYLIERYRVVSVLMNLAVTLAPLAAAGLVYQVLSPQSLTDLEGTLAFTAACATFTVLHVLLFAAFSAKDDGTTMRGRLTDLLQTANGYLVSELLFAIALASLIALAGWGGAFVAATIFALQAHSAVLVARANQQRQIAQDLAVRQTALSWGMVSALLNTLNAYAPSLARHSAAVARLSRLIAAELDLSRDEQDVVHTAGLLHDIGLIGRERPTPEDWRRIAAHPRLAHEMLRDMTEFGPVAEIVLHHHERFDGRGYPDKLAGEAIPLASRILFVAEAYDAMTGPDTYRTRRSSLEALVELRKRAGSQFDPQVVDALNRVLKGTDHAFRHSDSVHYRDELVVERRIVDARLAGAPTTRL
ncbi:HD domain-containing protein [Conexibacter sp. W3-3-2]|uniref:HD-GYP domain-containing protein n=1 Tax=Conexibacter sp. W3-3-2 TaxID=2675227 RepID=UPI0012BA259A|nr:HD domain-containing phosphohydrolase [Conexibacter sp. W3-3-2]MTD47263.1 HD domain-containing protein [Conexibacter sp. W3-3-2]